MIGVSALICIIGILLLLLKESTSTECHINYAHKDAGDLNPKNNLFSMNYSTFKHEKDSKSHPAFYKDLSALDM